MEWTVVSIVILVMAAVYLWLDHLDKEEESEAIQRWRDQVYNKQKHE